MLSRWIQENQRFLIKVGGAALLLLVFQWLFVWGARAEYGSKRSQYDRNVTSLRSLYANADPPVNRRLKQRTDERAVVRAALDEALRVYGARPTSPFILPAGEEERPQNYYFDQRTAVIDEITLAAADHAVNLLDPTLGLPQQLPRGADAKSTVQGWLWNLQVVRRALLAAVNAGVDEIDKVTDVRSDARRVREGDIELFGQPQQFEVSGNAAAVARWLEAIQAEDHFLVLVACKLKRDPSPQALGVVKCTALLMGVSQRKVEE